MNDTSPAGVIAMRKEGRRVVTWMRTGHVWAWEPAKDGEHTVADRFDGALMGRVDTRLPTYAGRLNEIERVGTYFDHQVVCRRDAIATVFRAFPELWSRGIRGAGYVYCSLDPAVAKRCYDQDVAAKRAGAKPPAEALEGAGLSATALEVEARTR